MNKNSPRITSALIPEFLRDRTDYKARFLQAEQDLKNLRTMANEMAHEILRLLLLGDPPEQGQSIGILPKGPDDLIAFNDPYWTDKPPYCNTVRLILKQDAVSFIMRMWEEERRTPYPGTSEQALAEFMTVNQAWYCGPQETSHEHG